jgi:hypothetical protein
MTDPAKKNSESCMKDASRHADPQEGPGGPAGPIVGRDFGREDGDDPVRRELLASAAGPDSAAVLGKPAAGRAKAPAGARAGLESLLFGQAAAGPVSATALHTAAWEANGPAVMFLHFSTHPVAGTTYSHHRE